MRFRKALVLGTAAFLLAAGAAIGSTPEPQNSQNSAASRYHMHPKLEVSVADFPADGLILDIGGGGEGVIGQLKGAQVVAIDLLKRESVI